MSRISGEAMKTIAVAEDPEQRKHQEQKDKKGKGSKFNSTQANRSTGSTSTCAKLHRTWGGQL